MLTAADHFARREPGGLVVDLYWLRREREDEFLVEVEDEREAAMGELPHVAVAIVIARQLLERALEGSGPTPTSRPKEKR